MSALLDPKAVIDPKAELASDVQVGPFTVIGPHVQIDSGTEIGPHCVINGPARIGRDNKIYQFASVGEDPQDKKYAGESTELVIGERNVIREFATLHRGTVQDEGVTRIGDDNLFMAYTHVAHDCRIGNQVILANAASLGGHVQVHDWAILGGFAIVHQFCRIGAHSFSGMGSVISKDVPPYVRVAGHPAKPSGVNSEGLSRRDFSETQISLIKRVYKLLYLSQLKLEEAKIEINQLAEAQTELQVMVEFLRDSERSIVR